MKITSLYLKNFMNHKESNLFLSNIKSALIVGKTKNNDGISNGVGKSTIFSAIEWALFNKVHKMTLDKVVRDEAKKCVVELCFELNGNEYKIHRSLSSKGTKNIYFYEKISNEWEKLSQRTPTETEEKIKETIKISHKAFQYSVLFRQADLSGLVEDDNGSEANTKKRLDALKEPLNLMRYSKKEKIVLDLMKPIKKEIAAKESAIEIIGNPSKDIKTSEDELADCIKQIQEKEKLISTDLQVTVDEKKSNLEKLKSTLSASGTDVHQKVEDQHVKVKKLNYSIKELGQSRDKTQSTIDSQKNLLSTKRESSLKLVSELSDKEAETHRDIQKISLEHKRVCDDELKGSKLLSRAEVELEYAKKSIPDSDKCPSCEQSITEEYRRSFEDKVSKIVIEKQDDIAFYKKQLSKCKAVKTKLAKELENAKKHKNDVDSLNGRIKSVKENISVYEDNIKSAEKDLRNIEIQMDSQSKELEESIKHYDDLKELAEKSDLTELNSKIFTIAREIKVYEQSIESMRTELQSLKTREGVLKERIKNREQDLLKLESAENEVKELRNELAIHQYVANSFSHKGIPTLIINTCLNELQLETNKALQSIRPDLEVKFDADLNFTYRRNGRDRDYHQLSYGQHVYIALAFKRGLATVVQKKMNIEINFLEFDEVDAALDSAGADAFADTIKRWQDDFQIFVITHRDSLKEKFSHAILVEEGDDGSEARLVSSW